MNAGRCVSLGGLIVENGRVVTREGTHLRVYECRHDQRHRHPLPTLADCRECPDFVRDDSERPTPVPPVVVTPKPKSSCCGGNKEVPVIIEAKPVDVFAQQQTMRHLAYHIYPVSGNGAWQRNVGRLVERLRIFNGKIVVAIVVDPASGRKPDPTGPHSPDRGRMIPGCDSPEAVMQAFGPWRERCDFIIIENDPSLREVVSMVPMFERLPRDGVTLYAQAKGTTRAPGHIAHHWSDVQYIIYFDYWLLVEEHLKSCPVTGAFKKTGPGWCRTQSYSDWHYSGSWFWFRNADLFAKDWKRIDQFWSGIESFTSQHFRYDEAACLFHEGPVSTINLYDRRHWKRNVDPAFSQWRNEHKRHETPF